MLKKAHKIIEIIITIIHIWKTLSLEDLICLISVYRENNKMLEISYPSIS